MLHGGVKTTPQLGGSRGHRVRVKKGVQQIGRTLQSRRAQLLSRRPGKSQDGDGWSPMGQVGCLPTLACGLVCRFLLLTWPACWSCPPLSRTDMCSWLWDPQDHPECNLATKCTARAPERKCAGDDAPRSYGASLAWCRLAHQTVARGASAASSRPALGLRRSWEAAPEP